MQVVGYRFLYKITFQPSTMAAIVLFVFVARYLSKKKETPIDFKSSLIELWLPVLYNINFILPSNFLPLL